MPKVYVVNKSSHNFSKASAFGEVVYLSEGRMSRYEPNKMARRFMEKMKDSQPDDYLLMCGLSTMNSIACALFAMKHETLNLLLYKNGRYLERNLDFRTTLENPMEE